MLFYLYSDDLAALREQLLANGIHVGEIEDGTPGPSQEMRLSDPDGYVLMVAQLETAEDRLTHHVTARSLARVFVNVPRQSWVWG